jgi:hypothetical protein
VEDRGNVRVAHARRRARFAQETKPRRFVTEIFPADDFQGHRTPQIDIEGFVSDPHRAATQLDRLSIFVGHQFIVLKALRHVFRCGNDCVFGKRLAGFDPTGECPV